MHNLYISANKCQHYMVKKLIGAPRWKKLPTRAFSMLHISNLPRRGWC